MSKEAFKKYLNLQNEALDRFLISAKNGNGCKRRINRICHILTLSSMYDNF